MTRTYTALHVACGIGGGALGYELARPIHAGMEARFENIAGIDNDDVALANYSRIVDGPAVNIDLFDERAYEAYNGRPPPPGWREATVGDIQRAAGGACPDVVFTSLPCQGFSGLTGVALSKTAKYEALNSLVHRSTFLLLEAFARQPPRLLVFENVPLIASRGRRLVDSVKAMLHSYGYATAETIHCCGKIGGLGQRRTRWLMVARHVATTVPNLFQPPDRGLLSIGDVLGPLPMPHDDRAGKMHVLPKIQAKAWWQLALIPEGGDHRDLREVLPGSFGATRTPFNNVFQVKRWSETAGAVTAGGTPTAGGQSVADPRVALGDFGVDDPSFSEAFGEHGSKFAVDSFDDAARTITGGRVGSGAILTADPRLPPAVRRDAVKYAVRAWDRPAATVTCTPDIQSGAPSVADVRVAPGSTPHRGVLGVMGMGETSGTITGRGGQPTCGRFSVADVRFGTARNGTMRVLDWEMPAYTVIASGDIHTSGASAVGDPRWLQAVIDQAGFLLISPGGKWHRPLTPFELGALQGFPMLKDGQPLELVGSSTTGWRRAFGNAVPPPSAQAVAEAMGRTLLAADSGWGFMLDPGDVWVSPSRGDEGLVRL